MTGADIGRDNGELIIRWLAQDDRLDPRPISLYFSDRPSGPWSAIAAGLENLGQYAWRLDNRVPDRIFLKIEVRDEAGNIGQHVTAEPVALDLQRPTRADSRRGPAGGANHRRSAVDFYPALDLAGASLAAQPPPVVRCVRDRIPIANRENRQQTGRKTRESHRLPNMRGAILVKSVNDARRPAGFRLDPIEQCRSMLECRRLGERREEHNSLMTNDWIDRPRHNWKSLVAYAAMIGATVGIFFVVRHFGQELTPSHAAGEPPFGATAIGAQPGVLLHLLLALAVVIVAGQLLARLFRHIGQPPVIGEVIGGILLGPSLLGRVWPEASQYLLPASVAPALGIVAQLGVILYMFVVGLELDLGRLRNLGHATIAISHASIVAPFLLGVGLALGLYSTLATQDVPFTPFALFLGVSMSVTAFPVLARILTDRRISKTNLGVMALACAATDDVTAWCLLAFIVGVAQAEVDQALMVSLITVAYIAAMVFVVRPLVARWLARYEQRAAGVGVIATVFVSLLLSAFATEWIGVHAIFGAFLFGAIIPHDSAIARQLSHKLQDLVTILFLPAFFAFTGMRTQIGLVSGLDQWLICGLIILVATVGKFGGTVAAARFMHIGWRDSAALGLLMNTRGLMELIVLNIGLDLRVISPTLFAMMVLMALVTTMTTSPLLQYLVETHDDCESGPDQPVQEPAHSC